MKNKEKIAIITSGFLPVPASRGGAVENLIDIILGKNEIKNKITPIIFSIYDENAEKMAKKYKNTEFNFIKINPIVELLDKIIFWIMDSIIKKSNSRSYRYIFQRLYFYRKCSKYLKKYSYDKVLLENHPTMYLVLKYHKNYIKYEGKYYYHCHNELKNLYGCEDIINNTNTFISVSEFRSESIKKIIKIEDSKFKVLLNCCSDDIRKNTSKSELEKLKNKYNIKNEKIILYVGRVVDDKGILELVKACNKLKNVNYKLLILGASLNSNSIITDYERKVLEEIKESNNRIILTGYVDHSDLYKYYDLADLLILPSICEDSAPLTIIEALTKGKAILTTKSGGIPEYVNKKCAILIDKDKNIINNLLLKIEKILNDDNLRKNMELESKKLSKKFTEDKFYDDFIKLISK